MEVRGHFVFQSCNTADSQFGQDFMFDEYFQEGDVIPYSEYYLGGHEVFRTTIAKTGEYLIDHVSNLEEEEIGIESFKKFSKRIPFIVKVTPVTRPQPFKCHPDNKLSKKLNQILPRDFPIIGSRKLLIVPITKCTVLAGFKSIEHVIATFQEIPEMEMLVDKSLIEKICWDKDVKDVRSFIRVLLNSSFMKVKKVSGLLLRRLRKDDPCGKNPFHNLKLMETIHKQDPGDPGIFLTYYCHLLVLRQDEALFVTQGLPYSIVEGEALECSNMRDNSICGALGQKKFVDEFMLSLSLRLTTEQKFRKEHVLWNMPRDEYLRSYRTIVPEFVVVKGIVPLIDHYVLPESKSLSLVIGLSGEARTRDGRIIEKGTAMFLHAGEKLEVSIYNEKFQFFQISVNV